MASARAEGGGGPGGRLRTNASVPGGSASPSWLGDDDEPNRTSDSRTASAAASDGDVPEPPQLPASGLRSNLEAQRRAAQRDPIQPVGVAAVASTARQGVALPEATALDTFGTAVLEGVRGVMIRRSTLRRRPIAADHPAPSVKEGAGRGAGKTTPAEGRSSYRSRPATAHSVQTRPMSRRPPISLLRTFLDAIERKKSL